MAADHRKKRLVAGSIGSSQELRQTNKKKVGLFKRGSNKRSNVSLEWDENNKNVVAKREQIGLSRRDLVPFLHLVPSCNFVLADVLSIPQEIFELENLSDVMSYDVWQRHLSESDRDYLRQFLPQGVETQEIVRGLLGGDNFHFGNPFIKWGTSVCRNDVHPDSVLQKELHLKEKKKVFYSGVEQYHNNMIRNLLTWKERWLSSEDSENHFLQQMSRPRRHAITFSHANEIHYPDAEEDVTATSESSSWGADDKAFSSDNQSLLGRQRELQNGIGWATTSTMLSPGLNMVEKPRKEQKLQKRNVHCSDGTKYMSYIKVSKEQHQRVVSTMKQSSNSIQSKSLSRVLGDLNAYHVQPFKVFEEEEQKKLQIHWMHLVKKDLPMAFAKWRRQQLERCQLMQSLEQEILEMPRYVQEEKVDEEARCHDHVDFALEDETIKVKMDGAIGTQECHRQDFCQSVMVDSGLIATSTQNHHSEQIGPISDEHEFHNDVDFASNNNLKSMTGDILHHTPEFPESFSTADITSSQGGSISPPGHDIWADNVPESFYNQPPLSSNRYDSTEVLSMDHTRMIEDHPAQMMNLESGIEEGCYSRKIQSDGQTHDKSFFNLCMAPRVGDGNGNEQLQHFFTAKERFPANFSMQVSQFPGHHQQQHHIGEQNIFNGDPIGNWAASSFQMPIALPPPPPQTLISEGGMSQNCFYGDHWSNMDCGIGPSHLIGNGNGSNVHSSLYCGELQQQPGMNPYCPVMTSPEQLILPSVVGGAAAFGGGLLGGGGMSTTGNMLPQLVHPPADWPEPTDNLSRLGMSHQNFPLQDSIAKSYFRSWKS
ncbi:uncharacterized protein LOC124914340 [Impatiens glandulifera]|uniref:uncharacterized protein LOC124914340 n=1 Tax=Impatiens glandulifera TaxID=253017 RepID=UPI001FB05622|nr:uncharacterized protein LOC124914340 [Impatiens glandulifera]